MKTARQVKAYITSYNTSDDSGNAPQPDAVSVSMSFCGAGPNPPTTARLRRIDNTHANPRALWCDGNGMTFCPLDFATCVPSLSWQTIWLKSEDS